MTILVYKKVIKILFEGKYDNKLFSFYIKLFVKYV